MDVAAAVAYVPREVVAAGNAEIHFGAAATAILNE